MTPQNVPLQRQLHEVEREIVFRKRLYGPKAASGDILAADEITVMKAVALELRRRVRPEQFDEAVGDMYRLMLELQAMCPPPHMRDKCTALIERLRPYCYDGIAPGELAGALTAV